ncbi:MAG TPA: hypothetical protein DIT13_07560 [Verrucomicrobiales bacterium]|nr:hypothetical protein [Verrucomicrobiales bacterium]HRJ08828.1 hypothetical protein [Prosthecobacter sp.]HRK15765.1 hypothetical protein [Prosthecobacter sp.]
MTHDDFSIEEAPPSQIERWTRTLIGVAKFCILLLAVPVIIRIHEMPLAEQNAMRAKLEEMKAGRDLLLARRDMLLRQVEWIKNDTGYLEIRARDHDEVHKKGEYVIRFED